MCFYKICSAAYQVAPIVRQIHLFNVKYTLDDKIIKKLINYFIQMQHVFWFFFVNSFARLALYKCIAWQEIEIRCEKWKGKKRTHEKKTTYKSIELRIVELFLLVNRNFEMFCVWYHRFQSFFSRFLLAVFVSCENEMC